MPTPPRASKRRPSGRDPGTKDPEPKLDARVPVRAVRGVCPACGAKRVWVWTDGFIDCRSCGILDREEAVLRGSAAAGGP